MVVSLSEAEIGWLIRLLDGQYRRVAREFPALSRTFWRGVETLFSHNAPSPHASMKTGIREASSSSAITMLKIRTARSEVRNGRSALPNSVQIEVDTVPSPNASTTWIAIFQGKRAIAA